MALMRNSDDERTLRLRLGSQVFDSNELPIPINRGTWNDSTVFRANDMAAFGGSVQHGAVRPPRAAAHRDSSRVTFAP